MPRAERSSEKRRTPSYHLLNSPGPVALELIRSPLGTRLLLHWTASESAHVLQSHPEEVVRRILDSPRRRVLCSHTAFAPPKMMGRLFLLNGYLPVFDATQPHDVSVGITSPLGRPVLNARHVDRDKSTVAAAWEVASGYPLAVDPLTHEGPILEKSEGDGTNDGRILSGPLAPEAITPSKVYQRLVDNVLGEEVVDYRVPVYRGRVSLVKEKFRPLGDRFSNHSVRTVLREPSDVFSDDERRHLGRAARELGLDYAEMDVLRDQATGRIYVVDASPVPGVGAWGLTPGDERRHARRIAADFDRSIESVLSGESFAGGG